MENLSAHRAKEYSMTTTPIAQTIKGHRVWIQGLDRYGIPEGTGYNVTYGNDAILITMPSLVHGQPVATKRTVSKGKGGIIDLEGKKVTQWAQGHTVASVEFSLTSIIITRA